MSDSAVVLNTSICIAYDTELNWYNSNPVLLAGQIACSSDYQIYKIGNGTTPWRNLPYNNAGSLIGVNVGAAELNTLTGITSNVQTQIKQKNIQISSTKPSFECTWFNVKSV